MDRYVISVDAAGLPFAEFNEKLGALHQLEALPREVVTETIAEIRIRNAEQIDFSLTLPGAAIAQKDLIVRQAVSSNLHSIGIGFEPSRITLGEPALLPAIASVDISKIDMLIMSIMSSTDTDSPAAISSPALRRNLIRCCAARSNRRGQEASR